MNPNIQETIDRFYRGLVIGKLERYPVVSLLGPRQCGKTTLAKNLGGRYFDMESEGAFLRLDAEWDRLMRGEELVIIDEAQCAPEIFPRLRGAIDSDRKRNGRFLLLGSASTASVAVAGSTAPAPPLLPTAGRREIRGARPRSCSCSGGL
jgi:predicted AAA+ superfamily ATPase